MLTLVLALSLTQAPTIDAPAKLDAPPVGQPERSATLFSEPRVKVGALVGRVGMGLLFGGVTAGLSGAVMVVLAFSGASAGVLVPGVILTAALTGLGTALGAALFGERYGPDLVDALVVAAGAAVVGGLLFLLGFFVPALMPAMMAVAGTVMFVGVPLLVQVSKYGDGPEPTFAVARF